MKSVLELILAPKFLEGFYNVGVQSMGIRRQAREAALQALFMIDFNNAWTSYQLGSFYGTFTFDKRSQIFADLIINGVIENRQRLDSIITRASENWSIQRMAKVDRALLRVACFELCCLPEIPRNVSINEAIEISKKYGSEDSPMFINGVLDKIASYIDKVKVSESESQEEQMPLAKISA